MTQMKTDPQLKEILLWTLMLARLGFTIPDHTENGEP